MMISNKLIEALPTDKQVLVNEALGQVNGSAIAVRSLINETRSKLYDDSIALEDRDMAIALLTTLESIKNGGDGSLITEANERNSNQAQDGIPGEMLTLSWDERRQFLIESANKQEEKGNLASAKRIRQSILDGDVNYDRDQKDEALQKLISEQSETERKRLEQAMADSQALAERAEKIEAGVHFDRDGNTFDDSPSAA